MLAPKHLSFKKKVIYAATLTVVAGATVFVLYRSFYSAPSADLPAETAAPVMATSTVMTTTELNFLRDPKFIKLRRADVTVDVESARTQNPFSLSAP